MAAQPESDRLVSRRGGSRNHLIPNHEDLAFGSVHRLADMIRHGALQPSELVEIYLARIRVLDPKLRAFVEVYEMEARAAAEYASAQAALGRFQGPLHGVPVVLKDLIDVAGRPTTLGSVTRKDVLADATATLAKRLVGAGMIILGKTHTVEFAFGGWGTNIHMGTPRNPWDATVHRVPGGSSSGSAVAVAAALAPAGVGTDTGGSVRIPASMCGLVGLKPTAGRVSKSGVGALSQTFDSIGPITRSVEDAALMFAAMEGPDLADPATLAVAGSTPLDGLKSGIRGLRVAVPMEMDLAGVDPDVLDRFSEALDVARRLGAQLSEMRLPESFSRSVEVMNTIISAEAFHEHGAWVEAHEKIDPNVRLRIVAGKTVSAPEYLMAIERHRMEARAFVAMLSDYDALLTPTTPIAAVTLDQVDESKLPLSRFTRPVNYYGCCALSIPMGLGRSGLPTSLQIIGRPFDEARALQIGWALEEQGGLLVQRPPLSDAEKLGR